MYVLGYACVNNFWLPLLLEGISRDCNLCSNDCWWSISKTIVHLHINEMISCMIDGIKLIPFQRLISHVIVWDPRSAECFVCLHRVPVSNWGCACGAAAKDWGPWLTFGASSFFISWLQQVGKFGKFSWQWPWHCSLMFLSLVFIRKIMAIPNASRSAFVQHNQTRDEIVLTSMCSCV